MQPERVIPFGRLGSPYDGSFLYSIKGSGEFREFISCKLRGKGAYAQVPDVPSAAYYDAAAGRPFARVSTVRSKMSKRLREVKAADSKDHCRRHDLEIESFERLLSYYPDFEIRRMSFDVEEMRPVTTTLMVSMPDEFSGRQRLEVPRSFMDAYFPSAFSGSSISASDVIRIYRKLMKGKAA